MCCNGTRTPGEGDGINQDFRVYGSPDELLREHHQQMSVLKAFIYRSLGLHLMNANVNSVRAGRAHQENSCLSETP